MKLFTLWTSTRDRMPTHPGVILFELLTGVVPSSRKEFEKAGLAEMLRVIKEVEPQKPSTKLSGATAFAASECAVALGRHAEAARDFERAVEVDDDRANE